MQCERFKASLCLRLVAIALRLVRNLRCVISAVDRLYGKRVDRINGTFQIRIVFKKDATATGDSMILLETITLADAVMLSFLP